MGLAGCRIREENGMSEYIDRETLLEEIEQQKRASKSNYPRRSFVVGDVLACIRNAPTADVAPVRHGKWEPGNPICPVCGENKFKDLDADVWADWQPKFCPNCGALMREIENGEK